MLYNLIQFANEQGASDLHLSPNRPAFIRKNAHLQPITKQTLKAEQLNDNLISLLSPSEAEQFKTHYSVDFAYTFNISPQKSIRVRAHYFQSIQGFTAVFRLIPSSITTLEDIHAPPILQTLISRKNGLILVTGATGSGKSTTLSALIHEINHTTPKHIITIEDPIEHPFKSHKALIEQRELHEHTLHFNQALKDALRADPDIILIGELRDQESVNLALQAAETGHLVLATLHTNSAEKSVNRLLSYFPSDRSSEIRTQLAETLSAVIAQELITIKENRYALFEIMIVNSAISNLIKENQITQIPSIIQTSKLSGMQTFKQHLEFLEKTGILSDLLAEKAQNLLNPDIYS